MLIQKAAIRKNNKIYIGENHSKIISKAKFGSLKGGEQGFLTNTGRFVDRKTAAKLAYISGQITERKSLLYSEDLFLKDD